MKRLHICLALTLVCSVAVVLTGCPRSPEEAADTGAPATGPAAAAEETGTGSAGAALTADLIEKWIASANDPQVEETMTGLSPGDGNDPEVVASAIKAAADSDAMAEVVKAHGFESAEQWAHVSGKVFMALLPRLAEMDGAEDPETLAEAVAALEAEYGALTDDERVLAEDAADRLLDTAEAELDEPIAETAEEPTEAEEPVAEETAAEAQPTEDAEPADEEEGSTG